MTISDVCRDVRLFLNGLSRDLPDIFSPPRRYPRPAAPRARPAKAADPAERKKAKEIIVARVKHWARVLDLEYSRVFVKDQRTLWGSCSGRRNLNFNWRLAAAPPEALDYVVIHELCHLREMNHSKRFWDHVGAVCPGYKAQRRWLRDNCAQLRDPGLSCRQTSAAVPEGAFIIAQPETIL